MPILITGTSGDSAHGETLTITGSGFGIKSPATPAVYDDFESGVVGQRVNGRTPIYGDVWIDDSPSVNYPLIDNTSPRSQFASRMCRFYYSSGLSNYTSAILQNRIISVGYFSFWYRWQRQAGFPDYSRNTKPWVIYGTDGIMPQSYLGWGGPPASDFGIRNSVQDTNGAGPTLWGFTDHRDIEGEWVRLEQYLVQNSGGSAADGTFQYWTHRPNASIPQIILEASAVGNYQTRSSGHVWRQIEFGYYSSHDIGNPAYTVYQDEIYFDVTQARVEFGNANTWAACTRRELQVPTQWSATSITVTVNRGQFSNTDPAYLYVVDSTGTISASGFLVSGGAVQTAAPGKMFVHGRQLRSG